MSKHSKHQHLVASNRRLAKQVWGDALDPLQVRSLREITRSFGFSIAMRDMLLLQGGWYVTHMGLLRLAKRHYCAGIDVYAVPEFCDPIAARWSFKATVYKSKNGKGFVGYGDADPSNCLPWSAAPRCGWLRPVLSIAPSAKRMASASAPSKSSDPSRRPRQPHIPSLPRLFPATEMASSHGQPRLRDQLCLLIRQHNLDPALVKAYAADFCGTETLKEASS